MLRNHCAEPRGAARLSWRAAHQLVPVASQRERGCSPQHRSWLGSAQRWVPLEPVPGPGQLLGSAQRQPCSYRILAAHPSAWACPQPTFFPPCPAAWPFLQARTYPRQPLAVCPWQRRQTASGWSYLCQKVFAGFYLNVPSKSAAGWAKPTRALIQAVWVSLCPISWPSGAGACKQKAEGTSRMG